MKILHLVLKCKWYDMIESGAKSEEYRERTPYWTKRFCVSRICNGICDGSENTCFVWNVYTHVCFHRGYTNKTMLYEISGFTIGIGDPKLGAPERSVYIIKLIDKD